MHVYHGAPWDGASAIPTGWAADRGPDGVRRLYRLASLPDGSVRKSMSSNDPRDNVEDLVVIEPQPPTTGGLPGRIVDIGELLDKFERALTGAGPDLIGPDDDPGGLIR